MTIQAKEKPTSPPKLGNTRVTGKEQFYTPEDEALRVLSRALSHFGDTADRIFLEPAGGTGAFIEASKAFGFSNFVSMDIEPRHHSESPTECSGRKMSPPCLTLNLAEGRKP